MKFLLSLLLLLFLTVEGKAQSQVLFNETLSTTSAVYDSAYYYLPNISKGVPFAGTISVFIQAESVASSSDDTLKFYPQYWLGPNIGWWTGSQMTLTEVYDSGSASTITDLVVGSHSGTKYMWKTDPTASTIQGYPFTRFGVKVYEGQNVNSTLKVNIVWY